MSVRNSKLRWWIDPMGVIILSVLISVLWLWIACSEFQLLVDVTVDTQGQQLITYISMTHSSFITAIGIVRASGPKLLVEIDIVMDSAESLMATHDVAIPNRLVWKRPTIVNHHNDGESHVVAMRKLIVTCVQLIIVEPGRGLHLWDCYFVRLLAVFATADWYDYDALNMSRHTSFTNY
jgi:hypothetical protein